MQTTQQLFYNPFSPLQAFANSVNMSYDASKGLIDPGSITVPYLGMPYATNKDQKTVYYGTDNQGQATSVHEEGTPENSKDINWGSLGTWLGIGGAVASPLLSKLDQMAGNTGLERIREKEVDQALQQNLANRDSLLSQSPEANRLAKANALQMGRSGAINAASAAGASNMANAGMNGDMSSALIAGVQAAAPVAQATASYDQALANTFTERANEQQVLNQQIGQNTMDRGTLAEMTAYYDMGNNSFSYRNILDQIAGGQGIGAGIYDVLMRRPKTTTKMKFDRLVQGTV